MCVETHFWLNGSEKMKHHDYCRNQFIFAAINFRVFISWAFSRQFIFADCRIVSYKNNTKYVYMDFFAAIYFHEIFFLAKNGENKSLAKIN